MPPREPSVIPTRRSNSKEFRREFDVASAPRFFIFPLFQEGDVLELSQVNDIRTGKLPQVGRFLKYGLGDMDRSRKAHPKIQTALYHINK